MSILYRNVNTSQWQLTIIAKFRNKLIPKERLLMELFNGADPLASECVLEVHLLADISTNRFSASQLCPPFVVASCNLKGFRQWLWVRLVKMGGILKF
ncbi:hypothetical protein CEXT_786641 [Caerostris extrusa]|uniref:Uncharacterized protein n=1 Tax=Caerostris extrusa TaxID=172846 RepID=A0AAV4Y8W4_CAEEX|nr:hypothetical protein CEXT_786641 [Caerostris extrusa]